MNSAAWFTDQFSSLKKDAETNQRLRWGIFLIVLLTLFYIALVLDDQQVEMMSEYQHLTLQKLELADLEPHAIWQQRATDEEKSLAEKEIAIWAAGSEALVRARIQSAITDHAEATELVSFNMRVGSFQPHIELSDISTIRLEFNAVYLADNILDFVSALESSTPLLKMESMSLRVGKKNNRARLMILAYVKTGSK